MITVVYLEISSSSVHTKQTISYVPLCTKNPFEAFHNYMNASGHRKVVEQVRMLTLFNFGLQVAVTLLKYSANITKITPPDFVTLFSLIKF